MATSRKEHGLRPIEVVLASTRLYSSLPLVGKHLEPFAGLTAMALWGGHYAPAALRAAVIRTTRVRRAVRGFHGSRVPPFVRARAQRRQCLYRSSMRYGEQPPSCWTSGAGPTCRRMRPRYCCSCPAAPGCRAPGCCRATRCWRIWWRGWVCLTMDYRVSPVHRWPRHVADVNAAIAWAGPTSTSSAATATSSTIAGCSAGGHLAALAALTPGEPGFRGELAEDADTSVDAVVGIYGRYDWQDRSTATRQELPGLPGASRGAAQPVSSSRDLHSSVTDGPHPPGCAAVLAHSR